MKTLVIFDANDPVQVAGAAILKKYYGTDYVLSATASETAERVHNLNDIDALTFSEDQYAIAASVLEYDFASLTLEADPTVFSASTLGKAGLTWEVNEHAGDWCYIKGAATDELMLISSNDATTLTFEDDLVNVPDAASTFAIIPREDIVLIWNGLNATDYAWGLLGRGKTSYPMGLLGGTNRAYSGLHNAADSTAAVGGFGANQLVGHYVAIQDVTDLRWFTRKIVSNTDAAITVDRAWDEAITNSSYVYIYSSLAHLLKDIYFAIYVDTYMRDPNHPYWNQLIDNEGRIFDGVITYNEALLAQILADGKVMFDALQVGNGGSLDFLDY